MNEKVYGYCKQIMWNESNRMLLYGVDYTSHMRDTVMVFLAQDEAEQWIEQQKYYDDAYLGEKTTYNKHKKFSDSTIVVYSTAERLLIKNRRVWIG